MAVTLYPGIKRLHLFYTTRYDTIRTSDVRDDLLGVKVWVSTQQGFNPQTTTPIDFGVGSTISVDNLLSNTQYYVRYAFISKIDPAVYTISNELNVRTYDELTSVYGELTNSPHYLARSTGSNAPDWQYATGTFRVWNISQEVTGNGPVYSIVANSATNGLQVTINSTTGVFTATNWSGNANSAKVTFKAVYNGIEVLRDWVVVSGIGQDAPQIRLSLTPDNFVYRDSTAVLAETPQVVATANLTNLSGTPVFTVRAFRSNGTEVTSPTIQFTQNNNVVTISRNQFHISNDIAYAVIRAEISTIYDEDTIFRLNNGTDTITVDLKNPVVQLQAAADGSVDPTEYLDTGATIEVYEGAEKLLVDNSSPYANGTWTVTNIVGTGIVPEDQPSYGTYSVTFPQHANMTQDTATIEYTVQYKTKAGFVGTRVVTQKFSKSKKGNAGDDGISVDLASESDVVFAENDGTGYTLPTGNSLRLYKGSVLLTSGVTYSGTTTKNGLTLTINSTTGAITLSGTSWTSDQENFTVSVSYNGIAYSAIYTIAKSKKGSDAVAIDLLSEADVVSANSDGSGYTLPTGNALRLYKGGVILASGVTYSGTTTQNGLTLTINSSGAITLSGASWTSNQENFTLTASFAGINYTAIYSIAKSRQGTRGANGEGVAQIYIRSELQPLTPDPGENLPPNSSWSTTVAGASGTAALWTSFGTRPADSTTYTWQVPTRVQGEAGNPLRNASGFLYFSTPQANAPSTPSASGFNFATGTFSSVTSGWAITFNVPSATTTSMWAVRYSVQETAFNGAQTVVISAPFTHQNFDGLVTFTNGGTAFATNTLGNVSTIDGGKITTGSLSANKLNIGNNPDNAASNRIVIDGTNNNIKVFSGGLVRVIIGNLA